MGIIGKELPKFFEQILNITEPWYIEKIEQEGNTINIYMDFKKKQSSNTTVNITVHTIRFKGYVGTFQSWSKEILSKSKYDN